MTPEAKVLAAIAAYEMVRAAGCDRIALNVHDAPPEVIAAARQLADSELQSGIVSNGSRFDAVTVWRSGGTVSFYGVAVPIEEEAAPAEVAS